MRKYWLMDQHGGKGPTALVETDGRLHIIDVLRFGPSVTKLKDQQAVWDKVIDRVAPTMKPLVDAATVDEEGVEPHPKLRRGGGSGPGTRNRVGLNSSGGRDPGVGPGSGGPGRKRSRGDR